MAKNNSPGLMVRESIEYPRTFAVAAPSSFPLTALVISSSVKFIELFFSNSFIVKRKCPIADNLIRLVSLTGNYDGIAGCCGAQRRPYRLPAIGHNLILCASPLQTFLNLPDDRERILASSIV